MTADLDKKEGRTSYKLLVAMFCSIERAKEFGVLLASIYDNSRTIADPLISINVDHEKLFEVGEWSRAKLFGVTVKQACDTWKEIFAAQ